MSCFVNHLVTMSSEVPPSGCTTKWLLRLRGVCNIGNKEINAPCRFPVTVCPTGYGTTTTFLDTTEMPDLNMDMELELSPAESLAIWKVVLLAALALLFIGILAICLIRWMVKVFQIIPYIHILLTFLVLPENYFFYHIIFRIIPSFTDCFIIVTFLDSNIAFQIHRLVSPDDQWVVQIQPIPPLQPLARDQLPVQR